MMIIIIGEKNDDESHPDYIPSIFSFLKSPELKKRKSSLKRYTRSTKLHTRRSVFQLSTPIVEEPVVEDTAAQLSQSFCRSCVQLQAENESLRTHITELEKQVKDSQMQHNELKEMIVQSSCDYHRKNTAEKRDLTCYRFISKKR